MNWLLFPLVSAHVELPRFRRKQKLFRGLSKLVGRAVLPTSYRVMLGKQAQ